MLFDITKTFLIAFFLFILSSCTKFEPLYKDNADSYYKLQQFSIITDKKKISKKIKKSLIEQFPSKKESAYILKIEGFSETTGTVSDTTKKISRYKTVVSANVKLYHRLKNYDKLIFQFEEKKSASFSLILNNVRSTIASKKNAETTSIRLLSEEIYKRILVFISEN